MHDFSHAGDTRLRFLTEISDIIVLNLLFLLSCLPIFTIGAAMTALYSVTLKIVRREYPAMREAYLAAFRENFRQSTLLWLPALTIFLIAGADYVLFPVLLPGFFGLPRMVLVLGCAAVFGILLYALSMVSRFVCTTSQLLRNAVKMFFGYFPTSLLLLLLHAAVPVTFLLSPLFFLTVSCIFLICGFAVVALISSFFLNRIFRTYEP